MSLGRIIVVLFWKKYSVLRQIEPEILELTIRKSQSNLNIVFILASCEEKGYYRVVLVGQLSLTAACSAGSATVYKVSP